MERARTEGAAATGWRRSPGRRAVGGAFIVAAAFVGALAANFRWVPEPWSHAVALGLMCAGVRIVATVAESAVAAASHAAAARARTESARIENRTERVPRPRVPGTVGGGSAVVATPIVARPVPGGPVLGGLVLGGSVLGGPVVIDGTVVDPDGVGRTPSPRRPYASPGVPAGVPGRAARHRRPRSSMAPLRTLGWRHRSPEPPAHPGPGAREP